MSDENSLSPGGEVDGHGGHSAPSEGDPHVGTSQDFLGDVEPTSDAARGVQPAEPSSGVRRGFSPSMGLYWYIDVWGYLHTSPYPFSDNAADGGDGSNG